MINSLRVLILAPKGRDAPLAAELLATDKQSSTICAHIGDLIARLEEGAGMAILTEEALQDVDLRPLATWMENQPPWSDFPFAVLTRRSGDPQANPMLARLKTVLGNVTFLERPFHPANFYSTIENALRGRRHQYQARSTLEQLAESERRLFTALRAGRLGPWEFTIATREFRASDHCKANFGRAPNEPFTYDDLLESVSPLDRERRQQAVDRTLSEGADYVIEYRCIWPDGSEHWVDMRARVLYDQNGAPATMVGVSSNITERKRADEERERLIQAIAEEREKTQQALRGERALSGVLMTSVPAGIVAYDEAIRITAWNPEMARMFGLASHAVMGRPLHDVILPRGGQAPDEKMREALDGVLGAIQEVELETADTAQAYFEIQFAPLRNGDGAIIGGVGFFRDVTERRKAEEQLRQAQKMEVIGQLTGGVAHDFNNLLAAVLGNLELLRKRLPDNPVMRRLLDGATQGAQRGASLTQRLLAFARRQELRAVSTDLAKLLADMQGLIERSLGPRIEVRVEVVPNLPPAVVDSNQLELAVLNLAVNARDAMPDGGRLTIRLDQASAIPNDLPLSGAFLRLSVIDTGTGMSEATLRSAIEPFFSTKEIGKGTGLGLSMVHGLAVQLGGALRLHSALGVGTTAELWLPVASKPVVIEKEVEPMLVDAPMSHILVVDDDALIAMNTVDMVEDLGHSVIEAYSGKQALEILASDTQVDALITDYAMPGMTGVELAAKARELRPSLPILLATGYADLPSGTNVDLPRLAKPYQQRDLAQQLARLLGAGIRAE